MQRLILYIAVHCTGTPTDTKIEDIQKYWREQEHWKRAGYHYIIKRDGTIVQLTPEKKIANGVKGFNENTIHIAYIGGIDKEGKALDNRTKAQEAALFDKLVELSVKYPKAEIKGHRDFPHVKKNCPSFDVKIWLNSYQPLLEAA